MRFQKSLIAIAVTSLYTPFAQAEFEITGYAKNETAIFLQDGQTIGQAKTTLDEDENSAGDIFKSEWMLRGFVNGDLGDNASLHAEINLIYDTEGVSDDLKGHKLYSQHDYLRELYVDTEAGDWSFRLGKQQVVWGTADGIKLLDIINPTDFRELNQNTQEDSRVPVWMANIERNIGDNANIQFIVSEARPNFIPGLNSDGDQGQAFMLTGVDTITGKVNGFLNIAPALGGTAASFQGFAAGAPLLGFLNGGGTLGDAGTPGSLPQGTQLGQVGGGLFTVQNFIDGQSPFCAGGSPANAQILADAGAQAAGFPGAPPLGNNCAAMLDSIAQNFQPDPNGNTTNLVTPVYDSANPDSPFEYMNNATFATFDTFAGISTKYEKNLPDSTEGNFGFRYKAATDAGTNWSVNYFYNYNPNPSVNLHWEDKAGNELKVAKINTPGFDGNGDGDFDDPQFGEFPASPLTSVALLNADNTPFAAATGGGPATLVFEETLDRIHNIGGAFDTSVDVGAKPVVIRGEFLYQQDVMVPVIDRNAMSIGDIAGALKTEETDFFKSVVGVDVNVMTNLLISVQLINFFNLDYIDEDKDATGAACGGTANCGRYTGDPANLSLANGLKKGDEIETFISFFLSKPFGEQQQHRWNNIIIAENDGGYWDRLDVEFSFTDFVIGTAEANFYWGDTDTLFGQFENSSNFQVGLRYLFQ